MKEVFVVGFAQVPVRRGLGASPRSLGERVIRDAIAHATVGPPSALFVGNMLSGTLSQQRQLGALLADASGLRGIEATSIEAACASGAAALRTGVMAIASGLHEVVVVCGVETMTHADKEAVTVGLATASDWEKEGAHGETFVSLNAALTRRYLDRYGLPDDALRGFSLNAHDNASRNDNALFRKRVSSEDYAASRVVAAPLRIFDVSPICDGAAAVVLASRDALRRGSANGPRVRVLGSAVATDTLALSDREDPLVLEAAIASTRAAYAQAGIEPRHVSFFELHDAYAVMAALSLEAAGFADRGRAHVLADEGRITLAGEIPVSTMGGLKARGHPVGATGVYQAVEACLQLRGEAGACQVHGADIGLLQGFGGTGATVITHVLERTA